MFKVAVTAFVIALFLGCVYHSLGLIPKHDRWFHWCMFWGMMLICLGCCGTMCLMIWL